jgi:TatD DNase family protein
MTNLVDFHCHLDLYPDFERAVERCERAGVFTLTVTTTPEAWRRNADITVPTKHVRAALGLHPQLVADRAAEITLWEKLLPETRYVGEVGLDAGPRYYGSFDAQKTVFGRVLDACAEAGDKILSVHSVRSAKIVLDMIEARLPPDRGRVVLHWFTGSASDARRAVALGCYFSINEAMLEKIKPAVLGAIPPDRMLTETDGPFTRTDARAAEPIDAGRAVRSLARLLGTTETEAGGMVLTNLRHLLGRGR